MSRSILYLSAGIVHPTLKARKHLRRLLVSFPTADIRVSANIEDLADLAKNDPDAVVLYLHYPADEPAVVAALDSYVRAGGNLLAIHGAAASFKGSERYAALLGGRFRTHGRIGRFVVNPMAGKLEELRQNLSFGVVDELYIHQLVADRQVQYVVSASHGEEPVVWVRKHGLGRVAYCALGHRSKIFRLVQVRTIIHGLLNWLLEAS